MNDVPVPDDMIDTDLMAEAAEHADHSVTLEQVREALSSIPGSMDDDFAAEREERFTIDDNGIHWGFPHEPLTPNA